MSAPQTPKTLSISIGKAPDNQYPIFHPSVLDYHAQLVIKDGIIWLTEKSQGMKTHLKLGDQWIRLLKGPVSPSDILRFSDAPPVTLSQILNAQNIEMPIPETKRCCAICRCPDEPVKISACIKCSGVYVAQPADSKSAAPEATIKLVRCFGCAAIFPAAQGVCPECGLNLVKHKL